MNTIGDRIKEERARLGFGQEDFAAYGGVKKLAQIKYEQNKRRPDTDYLKGIAKTGADIMYVVTGVRSVEPPSNRINPIDALQLVAGVLGELGLTNLTGEQMKILVGYTHEYSPTRQQLIKFITTMYAYSGIEIGQKGGKENG